MSIIAAVIASAVTSNGGGGGGGSPIPADINFNSDSGSWTGYGTTLGYSSTTASHDSYTYPDNSQGMVYTFTGNQEFWSPNLGNANAWTANLGSITIDYWFYPTAAGIQLLTEANSQQYQSYHYSVLEINSDLTIQARFWDGAAATSSNNIVLNQWNHIYWACDWNGGHYFSVNGVNTNTGLYYTRSGPGNTSEYFGIGYYDLTHLGNTGRFQGKIGALNIHDSVVASTFESTKAKYGIQ
jgi:hypothetical protein